MGGWVDDWVGGVGGLGGCFTVCHNLNHLVICRINQHFLQRLQAPVRAPEWTLSSAQAMNIYWRM